MPIDDLSPGAMRSLIVRNLVSPALFRVALLSMPRDERDAWVDAVFALDELPSDGSDLPAGCVPYLPCPVDALWQIVERAPVGPDDVFVDVGAGVGRAAALVHLLTGATAVGVEIQAELVKGAHDLLKRLEIRRVSCVLGDAVDPSTLGDLGSVYFLYCPFSGARLAKVLDALEVVARSRAIRVCTVDLPLPARAWLTRSGVALPGNIAIYHSHFSP